ncbi:hypothetical protein ACHAPU_008362 [Fusarium lateritium]
MGASMSTLQPRRRGEKRELPFEDCERPAKMVCLGIGLGDRELHDSSADLVVFANQSSVEVEGETENDAATELELALKPESKGESVREQEPEIEPKAEPEPKDEGKPDIESVDRPEHALGDNIEQELEAELEAEAETPQEPEPQTQSHDAYNALLSVIEGLRVSSYYTLTFAEGLIASIEITPLEGPVELQQEAVQDEIVSQAIIDKAVGEALDKEREDTLCRHFERAMVLPLTGEEILCRDFKRAIVMPSNPAMDLDELKKVSFGSMM